MLTWLEVSKKALSDNLTSFQQSYPHHRIIPVIKSNAYGAGLEQVVSVIAPLCPQVSVVSTTEGLLVRELMPDHTITVLSIIDPRDIKEAIINDIELPVYNSHWLNLVEKTAKKLDLVARIHIKLDMGTHRIGFAHQDANDIVKQALSSEHLQLKGIFSHYAASEELLKFTKNQTALFDKTISTIKQKLPTTSGLQIHMACSAASEIGAIPTSSNALRIGLSLYGLWPSSASQEQAPKTLRIDPILTWKTSVIHLQEVKKGDFIGYGCSYKVVNQQMIATLPVGYHDGYDRRLSNKGHVLIDGILCPVRGRVCMNLTMVDVSEVKNTTIGDEVVLMGKQKGEEITPEEIAKLTETINYDVISHIHPDLKRVLVS